jgi:hypothetical protein
MRTRAAVVRATGQDLEDGKPVSGTVIHEG